MVKNIAYATEEETLMGNGVNLRTLTNDGGSAVISDYGAHLLRWAPGGAAGCNLDAPHMAFRSWSAGWRGSAGCASPGSGRGLCMAGRLRSDRFMGSHDCASGRWTKGRLPVPVCGMCWIPND